VPADEHVVKIEPAEIRDFLALHMPFDMLPPKELENLAGRLTARRYPQGTVIVPLGSEHNVVYILLAGAVDIFDGAGTLVDRDDPGSSFGLSSVLAGRPSVYQIVAHEDTECLLLPGEEFHRLMRSWPELARHFMRQQVRRVESAVLAVKSESSTGKVMRTAVRDILVRAPVTVPSSTSIAAAAQLMTAHGISALLVTHHDRLAGIVTDRDVRSKVVAAGLSSVEPVTAIMTADPVTISPDRLAFEVMVKMTQLGVHHLPVVSHGALLGMVSSGDVMRLEHANPVHLVGDVARQTTLDGLRSKTAQLPEVVTNMVRSGASAHDVARVLTAVCDAVTRTVVRLAEAELGAPPARYCWVARGSVGRLETGLQSDLESGLIIADTVSEAELPWFTALATKVVDDLEACGYPRNPAGLIAANLAWCAPLATWRRNLRAWLDEPDPKNLLLAQTCFDMRAVVGDEALLESLQVTLLARVPKSQQFLAQLARDAQGFTPPTGFFRDVVLGGAGEHRATLDVKSGGLTPILQIARLSALSRGQDHVNTLDRLNGAGDDGALSRESGADLADAFELLSDIRLRHQVEQLAMAERPDSQVPPASLRASERRQLKEAFTLIRQVQRSLGFRHRTDSIA